MVHAREQTHTVLYKGSEPPMSERLRRMREIYARDAEPMTLQELKDSVYERNHGRKLSGVIRQLRDEGW